MIILTIIYIVKRRQMILGKIRQWLEKWLSPAKEPEMILQPIPVKPCVEN